MTRHRASFNVAQLLKEPIGATRAYEVEVSLAEEAAELTQNEPLVGDVRMLRTNRGIFVEGDLSGSVTVGCSRCLNDVSLPVDLHIEEEFQPTVDVNRGTYLKVEEDDASLLINDQHVLDMTEVLRQALLLEIPMHVLCKPDCAGLCPTCGHDLSTGPCDCSPTDTDPRWEKLNELLADADV